MERCGDGIAEFREDEVAGMEMDGGGGEESFTRKAFRIVVDGALKCAAMQDESVELFELAARKERVFSQAAGPQRCTLSVVS